MNMNPKEQLYILCEACFKPVPSSKSGSVVLRTIDPTRTYRSSNKKIISGYRWRLCAKHFKLVVKTITKAIEEL